MFTQGRRLFLGDPSENVTREMPDRRALAFRYAIRSARGLNGDSEQICPISARLPIWNATCSRFEGDVQQRVLGTLTNQAIITARQ
jgi:hypothetical protein